MGDKGFTILELLVTIAIVATLSGLVMYAIVVYINTGKDASVRGNMVILIPSGEVYYNVNTIEKETYRGFCESNVIKEVWKEIPRSSANMSCPPAGNPIIPGICCGVSELGNAWAACAMLFTDSDKAFCVDSTGHKKDIEKGQCTGGITTCGN